MKKLSNILGLWLLMLGMVACESSDAPYNGYIETTQEGAATLVLKGYENPQSGFTVFEPEGFRLRSIFRTRHSTASNTLL